MWPFKTKKNLEQSGILTDYTEWHCHLLPGVDDGVKTLQESLDILSVYERHGVKTVWLTPHIMEDVPNETESLRQRFDELKKSYKGKIQLHLASENMLDNLFDKRLEDNDFLPIGERGNTLLIETSFFTPPVDLYDKIDRLRATGYFPLLAHPERYMYMENEDYDRLREMGVKMQLNLFSLFGMYGPVAKEKAQNLLKKGFYTLVGSDTHKMAQLQFALHHKSLTNKDIKSILSLPKL